MNTLQEITPATLLSLRGAANLLTPKGRVTRAVHIRWDADPEDADFLPTSIDIPKEIENDEEKISDYITEQTGFCHYGFSLV